VIPRGGTPKVECRRTSEGGEGNGGKDLVPTKMTALNRFKQANQTHLLYIGYGILPLRIEMTLVNRTTGDRLGTDSRSPQASSIQGVLRTHIGTFGGFRDEKSNDGA